jgi:high-affinity iron transporter
MAYLRGGIVLRLMLSGLLALLILFAGEALAGPAGEWFQAALALVASLLILQMVGWMRRHGPTLKHDLRKTVDATLDKRGGIGLLMLAMLAMLAVGREGSETVVFLYGLGINKQGAELGLFAIGGAMGLALAVLTFLVLQASSRIISWRRFLRSAKSFYCCSVPHC